MKEYRFFYVPDTLSSHELPADEAMHAVKVLRLGNGDEIFLMDGKGSFYRAIVTMASPKHCLYEIEEQMEQQKAWNGHIHLAIAPTKMMDRVEWLVEKATEIGFDEISFLNCKYSERKIIKSERLEKIVVSAMKQSRKPWLPVVHQMLSFKEFIQAPRSGHKFIAHCYDEIKRSDLFNILSSPDVAQLDDDITVLIGPEGDFSLDEVQLAIDNGYQSITLGNARLRTETAALAAVMMAQLTRRKV